MPLDKSRKGLQVFEEIICRWQGLYAPLSSVCIKYEVAITSNPWI